MARRAYLLDRVVRQNKLGPMGFDQWTIATYSMLGSALVNIAMVYPETQVESLAAVETLLDRLLNDDAIRRYETRSWRGKDALLSLDRPDNGHLGYLGHLNLLLADYHYLGGKDPRYTELFKKISASMIGKMSFRSINQAETYPSIIFIADNAAAVASIALHDDFVDAPSPRFGQRWVETTKRDFTDPDTNLLVHTALVNGNFMDRTRGCTIGWNSFYLPFVDAQFAKEQYDTAKKILVTKTRFGFAGLKEFPEGVVGKGDADSGPVLFGLSMSGTGFIVAAAKLYGDARLLSALLLTAETAGFTFQWNGQRQYLLAPMVGDAVMLAMKTAVPWDKRFIKKEVQS
jgi:hypothetical protein